MLEDAIEVIQEGDDRGNNMAFRVDLPSGVKIFALGTENNYGGEWDLGPTWNYIVLADKAFMVDTGNKGMGMKLLGLMERLGLAVTDLEFILLSHGHEDHDGGLAEIAGSAPVNIMAHEIYDRLIRFYPTKTPPVAVQGFPASCWHCPMPKDFSDTHCVHYHKTRSTLRIKTIPGSDTTLDRNDAHPLHYRATAPTPWPFEWAMKPSSWAIPCCRISLRIPPGRNFTT